ncbi:MAG: hypothetical protein GPJ50_03320 [Candidatus Heimdallarchaeota archaeon]|nr:hypothetical protein [Candidatus Heimdallarchaeota archaeon]
MRLNSQRVPQKSIRCIGEESLIGRAIRTLNQVDEIEDIILSCSDWGIKFFIDRDMKYSFVIRNRKLDENHTTFNEVLDSVIEKMDTDYIIFLSCTSPFIKASTISEMINKIEHEDYDSAFAASEHKSFCWFNGKPLNYKLDEGILRTQDLQPILIETSSLYIFSKEMYKTYNRRIGFKPFIKTLNNYEGIDIDTVKDFEIAELIAKRRKI